VSRPVAFGYDAGDGGDAGEAGGETNEENGGSGSTDIDLRDANVVEVAFEAADKRYAFNLSLHHDDSEERYTNWWQVTRLDWTRLGRRELLYPHSVQPFTRSESVEITDDVSCVIVHSHDQTHGYGGVAAVVDIDDAVVRGDEMCHVIA